MNRRSVFKALVIALAGPGAMAPAAFASDSTGQVAVRVTQSSQALPAALRPLLYQALAKDAATAYAVNDTGCATLPRQKLAACFGDGGVRFRGAGSPSALRLAAWGRGNRLRVAETVKPVVEENRVRYTHGNLSEWWQVLPIGFEQGFTIAKRPDGKGALTLTLIASGSSGLRRDHGGTLRWGRLRYGRLVVTDAQDRVVPATLKATGDRILIAVNDAHATYPLTIDPLLWLEQKVVANDGAANGKFGFSVAVSGTTAFVGVPRAAVNGNEAQGAVYVFTESDGRWSQAQKLTAGDGAAGDEFGYAVAFDGTFAFIGADNPDGPGAAYVFAGSGGSWSQTQKLTGNGEFAASFGYSVAVSGATAVVGAPDADVFPTNDTGAAYVFGESAGVWTRVIRLIATNGAEADHFGDAVALSGTTIVVGADCATFASHECGPGAVYVFSDSGGHWTQTQQLGASDGVAGDHFGISVALAGTTALIGAWNATFGEHAGPGAAYVFDDSNGTWTQTQKLTASNGVAGDDFGRSVALDGTTALIGADCAPHAPVGNGCGPGAAYLFEESNGVWAQTRKLTSSDGAPADEFGTSVGLDGTTALVGAVFAGGESGGAAYFENESNLGLSVVAPATIAQGQNYVSQTIATNNASVASPAVTATMIVPAAASFVSATATQGSCSEAAGVVTCDFGAIGGNAGTATANVTLKASGESGGTITNTASVAKATPPLTASGVTKITLSSPPPDQPPVAQDGTLNADESTTASGTLKASDPDGDALTFSIVGEPRHGRVSLADASRGAYTYTPDADYVGSDSFTFKASDGQLESNVAKTSITVNRVCQGCNAAGGSGGFGWPPLLVLCGLVLAGACTKRRRALQQG